MKTLPSSFFSPKCWHFFPCKCSFSVSRGLGETFLEVRWSGLPAAPEQTRVSPEAAAAACRESPPGGQVFTPKALMFSGWTLQGGRKRGPAHRCAGKLG